MARAHNIWIVVGRDGGTPIAAFTVKRELRKFLSNYFGPPLGLHRIKDGAGFDPAHYIWVDANAAFNTDDKLPHP